MPNDNLQRNGQYVRQAYGTALEAMGLNADEHPPISALGIPSPTCPKCGAMLTTQVVGTNQTPSANGAINNISIAGSCNRCNEKFAVIARIEYSVTVTPLPGNLLPPGAGNGQALPPRRPTQALPVGRGGIVRQLRG